jgi:hypothetical protein
MKLSIDSLPKTMIAAVIITTTFLTCDAQRSRAATLAAATFDTDTYMFVGTNNEFETGISTFTDYSGGVPSGLANSHFNFGVIKFDDLTGINTVADGGPNKYLTLETPQFGAATIGVSVAGDDVQNGYPSTSGSFNGPGGTADDRLQWYFDNIKGDDASFGGYAGGAQHIGVLDVYAKSTYSLDVTSVVDAWIEGSTPNYGFGLWAVASSGGDGNPVDFASMENPILGTAYHGPLLTSDAAPAPSTDTFIVPVANDVMTSLFFTGTDLVRGYAGDGRTVHRVSTENPFGTVGAETIYLSIDPGEFTGLSEPVAKAVLSLESVDGGFGANADAANPFTVSAHAVDTDPLTAITDDTNPSGPIDWLTFYNDHILDVAPGSSTVVDGFGTVEFDITSLVNDWIAGTNTVYAVALTGKNDTSGGEFLHGFLNNSDNSGATFLTLSAVPEPGSAVLCVLGLMGLVGRRSRWPNCRSQLA